MRIEDRYVEICKGHLFCDKERCLSCHIGKRNRRQICYRPVLLNRDYQGQSALNVIRHSLEDTNIFDSQQTKSNIPYGDGTTVRNDGSVGNKTADTYSDDEGTYFKRFEMEEEA